MTEKQINDKIIQLQESIGRKVPRYSRQIQQAFDLARARVSDIIAKYAKDGKVPTNRINAVIRELSAVEAALYRDLLSQTTIVIEDAAETAGEGVNEALVAAVGIGVILALNEEQGTSDALSAAGVLMAIGMGLLLFIKKVLEAVFSRTESDGLNLRDRLKKLASEIFADIRKTLRKSSKTGEDLATIQRNIADVFGETQWRVDRIADTESHTAFRTAVMKAAESSELVEAVKIIDFQHGDPAVHRKHKCYVYAHRDEHGMGEGVYPATTRKIRNPHAQCRSVIVLVLREGVLDA